MRLVLPAFPPPPSVIAAQLEQLLSALSFITVVEAVNGFFITSALSKWHFYHCLVLHCILKYKFVIHASKGKFYFASGGTNQEKKQLFPSEVDLWDFILTTLNIIKWFLIILLGLTFAALRCLKNVFPLHLSAKNASTKPIRRKPLPVFISSVADCPPWPGYPSFSLTEGGNTVHYLWRPCKYETCFSMLSKRHTNNTAAHKRKQHCLWLLPTGG